MITLNSVIAAPSSLALNIEIKDIVAKVRTALSRVLNLRPHDYVSGVNELRLIVFLINTAAVAIKVKTSVVENILSNIVLG